MLDGALERQPARCHETSNEAGSGLRPRSRHRSRNAQRLLRLCPPPPPCEHLDGQPRRRAHDAKKVGQQQQQQLQRPVAFRTQGTHLVSGTCARPGRTSRRRRRPRRSSSSRSKVAPNDSNDKRSSGERATEGSRASGPMTLQLKVAQSSCVHSSKRYTIPKATWGMSGVCRLVREGGGLSCLARVCSHACPVPPRSQYPTPVEVGFPLRPL